MYFPILQNLIKLQIWFMFTWTKINHSNKRFFTRKIFHSKWVPLSIKWSSVSLKLNFSADFEKSSFNVQWYPSLNHIECIPRINDHPFLFTILEILNPFEWFWTNVSRLCCCCCCCCVVEWGVAVKWLYQWL